jgi:hypothetical protein
VLSFAEPRFFNQYGNTFTFIDGPIEDGALTMCSCYKRSHSYSHTTYHHKCFLSYCASTHPDIEIECKDAPSNAIEGSDAKELCRKELPLNQFRESTSVADRSTDECQRQLPTLLGARLGARRQTYGKDTDKNCCDDKAIHKSLPLYGTGMALNMENSVETLSDDASPISNIEGIPARWSDEPIEEDAMVDMPIGGEEDANLQSCTDCEDLGCTLVMRNIPSLVLARDILKGFVKLGLAEDVVLLYVPGIVTTKNKPQQQQLDRFGFVHVKSRRAVAILKKNWHNQWPFPGHAQHSGKPLDITFAKVQGAEANLSRWNTGKTARIRNANFRPMVFDQDLCERVGCSWWQRYV